MIKKAMRYMFSPKNLLIVLFIVVGLWTFHFVKRTPTIQKPKQLPDLHKHENIDNEIPLSDSGSENKDSSTSIMVQKINDVKRKTCSYKKVKVNVNYKKKFDGLKINNELYVPFNFLESYYEVSGEYLNKKTTEDDEEEGSDIEENEEFLWSHTSKKHLDPTNLKFSSYSVFGMYLNFRDSDVANRARVKCICGKYEVPITTQWDPKGYYYPTQIAQYGLSHLSKYFGKKVIPKKLKLKLKKGLSGKLSTALNIFLTQNEVNDLRILKIKMVKKVTAFSVKVIASDDNVYQLYYVNNNSVVSRNGRSIYHGIGLHIHRNEIVRDIQVDFVKGLSFREGKKEGKTVTISVRKIVRITFQNVEYISSVRFTNVDHVSMFLSAADWFVDFQDNNGGWKVNVSRIVFKGMRREAGWYSSMGQGQAISLLSRVYKYTGQVKYLRSALKATNVFKVPSNKDGVLAMLFGKFSWYEEYPTTPPLYVLNGFIYSLFGLYDLSQTASSKDTREPKKLFDQGINSLETLLPLFDNGHGSFYDLRHVSVPGHPPNRARWQYHRVHLEQLYAIVDITKSATINRTLLRWIEYASGVPSRHN